MISLQDVRYRQRYLDGIVNSDNMRRIFTTRARIVQFVRRYLDQREFLEVGPLLLLLRVGCGVAAGGQVLPARHGCDNT